MGGEAGQKKRPYGNALPRLSFGSRFSCNDDDGGGGVATTTGAAAGNRIELFTKSSIEPATALNNGFLTTTRDVSLCIFLADIFTFCPFCRCSIISFIFLFYFLSTYCQIDFFFFCFSFPLEFTFTWTILSLGRKIILFF